MENSKASLFAGLVMAGGASSRMKKDKAELALNSGKTLLELACQKIKQITPVWHVSCARGKPKNPYPCLEDDLENFGPLGGILKGLENAALNGFQGLLVLACDLPLINAELLQALPIAHMAANPAPLLTVYQHPDNGLLETLSAVYDVRSLSHFYNAVKSGQRKLNLVIPDEFQLRIPVHPALKPFFLNCNTPDDFERALQTEKKLKKRALS